MSLKFVSVALDPSEVLAGGSFNISVAVYDDYFEFGTSYGYDEYQGFGNEAQTIGGKLKELPTTNA